MCADYIRTSVQVTEIESALGNEQHMNGLLGLIEMTTQPSISMQAATQQGNDSSSGGQRTIPDEPSSQGPFWLGECIVCHDHENEGFLCARENTMLVCGHPLCFQCANHILNTTSCCPKCRRPVEHFIRLQIPAN